MEKFATTECASHEILVTAHTLSCLSSKFREFAIATGVTYKEQAESKNKKIWIVGIKDVVERVRSQIEKLIEESTLGDIHLYQIEYMTEAGLFEVMKTEYHLHVCEPSESENKIVLAGESSAFKEAKHKLQDILQKITESQYKEKKPDHFIEVFENENTRLLLSDVLRKEKLVAVCARNDDTITFYSGSNRNANRAMSCLNDLIWDGRYPDYRLLNEGEERSLSNPEWEKKKAELEKKAEPLKIMQLEDEHYLRLVGLASQKEPVLAEITIFFRKWAIGTSVFKGNGKRVSCLYAYKPKIFQDLAKKYSANFVRADHPEDIQICATQDSIEVVCAELKTIHDSVREDEFILKIPAMIQQIKSNKKLLEAVGSATQCIIASQEDSDCSMTTNKVEETGVEQIEDGLGTGHKTPTAHSTSDAGTNQT